MRSLVAQLPPFLVVVALVSAAPEPSAAQTGLASLAPGARVRVTAASLGPTAQPARVVRATDDTLIVHPDGAKGFDVTLPRAEITQLDVSAGRRTHKARMALVGSAVGGLIGIVAGAASFTDPCVTQPSVCSGFLYETRGSDELGGFVGGALLGAAAGAIAGHFWTEDKWTPHPLRLRGAGLRIQSAPQQRRTVALVLWMNVPRRSHSNVP